MEKNMYVEAEGSKNKIVETIMQTCEVDREVSERCIAFINENQKILSDEELFSYSKLEEHGIEGVSEFVSEEGKYYISLKKSTIFLVILYLESQVPVLKNLNKVSGFIGIPIFNKGYMNLDENWGQLCVMMELARNRKRGAETDLLKKFRGECCNNQLGCKYNDNGFCRCDESRVKEICEEFVRNGIVKKKGKKYYYIL